MQPVSALSQHVAATIPAKRKNKKTIWIILAAVGCVVAITALLFLFGGGFLMKPTPTEPLAFSEDTAAIEAADASVVTIFCYDYDGELAATGSGFLAFNGRTVVTNYHVMTSAYTCKISTNQDISYNVTDILCYSKEQDIAILYLEKDTGLQPLTLGDSSMIKKGETVVAIGSPLGIKNTVSTGVLSGRLMEDSMYVLQFTAPISNGSSGGALFDNNGNVIGITYASYVDGQNLNLAIPVELANELYNNKGLAYRSARIYIEANPYVEHLEKYKNVTEVTIADLKNSPKEYHNKVIKITAYVSSCYDSYNNIYISSKSDINFDVQYDRECALYCDFEDTPVIRCQVGDGTWFDAPIEAAQQVVIVGKFDYIAKGEPYGIVPGFFARSKGHLEADLIYHAN